MSMIARRSPMLWVLLVALSCASGVFAWRYFAVALPIVAVDIRMDRSGALAAAEQLAIRRGWGPTTQGIRQSAAFEGNSRLQAFVEREAGGKDAFRALTTSELVSPYVWDVSRFAPGNPHEVTVAFRPDGRPIGFSERLPESAPGAALPVDRARQVAEHAARTEWQIDLAQYRAVETAARTQPGKRVDHTFTYEHTSERVGPAPIRLRLVVGGDRLTGLERFVQVPEDFDRRYAAMRTGNDAIAGVAGVAIAVLLLIGGVGGGLVLLLRRRATAWGPSIRLGLMVGALQLVASLASYPLIWQGYDTAVNSSSFVGQWLLGVVTAAGAMATLLALTFAAAEGLTRLAFGSHPQFWRVWSRDAGASPEIARRTAIGYLMVPIDLAYVVGLYFITTRLLGWWTPSDTLVDPNVLASFLPWSTPVASALQAGIWEECLFRAIPLAGGALIGQRFGRRRLGIVIAMVLQIVIFGAGHANYPGSPPYARPVELIIPSVVFGLLYLRLGLLPAIILHSAYDLVLMALPVMAASSPRLWDDKIIVVGVLLVPVFVVGARRLREGAWTPLPDALRNSGWMSRPPVDEAPRDTPVRDIGRVPAWVLPAALLVAVLGAAAGLIGTARRAPTFVQISAPRAQVERAARAALDARGAPREGWRLSSAVEHAGPGPAHRFVRETSGRQVYDSLLGEWLPLPSWRVRLARFDGPVEARAEEWSVSLGPDGDVRRVAHRLPEGAAGATLTEEEARARARAALERVEGMRADEVTEVAAGPRRLPQRTDWTFTYRLTSSPLRQGELRYVATLSGDEVVSTGRTVYIIEEWLRARRQREAWHGIAAAIGGLPVALCFFFTFGAAVLAWARARLAFRLVLVFAALQLVAGLLGMLQSWPVTLHGLSTTRPFWLQVVTGLGAGLVGVALLAGVIALPLGLVAQWVRRRVVPEERRALWLGLAIGVALVPLSWITSAVRSDVVSFVGDTRAAAALLPWIEPSLDVLQRLALGSVAMLVVATLNRITHDWTRHRLLTGAVALVSVGLIAPSLGFTSPAAMALLLVGALAGLALYVVVLRHDVSLMVLIVGVRVLADLIQFAILPPFPGARIGAVLAAPLAVTLTWWLWRLTRRLVAHPAMHATAVAPNA